MTLTDTAFRKLQPDLLRFAYHLIGNEADAEDLVQQAAIHVLERGHSHDLRMTLRAACRYRALQQRKRRTLAERTQGRIARNAAVKDSVEELPEALNYLTGDTRRTVELTVLEDYSGKEAAQRLGTTVTNVWQLKSRGLKTLRGILSMI